MKRVKDIPFFKNIREVREFEFGVFYYFDGLVISELKEGIVFDWSMAERAINAAKEIFGEDIPIAYISNRIHSYSVVPTEWLKFYKNRHRLDYYCIVGASQNRFASLILERLFFKESVRQFRDLETAIAWTTSKVSELEKGNPVNHTD